LQEQGVPIISLRIVSDHRWDPPFVVDYVIQSSSRNDKASPEDPLYLMLADRSINLAKRHGLNAGGISETVINTQGEVLLSAVIAIKEDIIWSFDRTDILDNNAVAGLLDQKIEFLRESIDKVDVSTDIDDVRWVTIELSIPGDEIANSGIVDFINHTRSIILKLNSEEMSQIAVYQINLSTIHGKPLLTYIHDIQLGSKILWQSDDLSVNLFSNPPTVFEPEA
jgi:hypothetical protein